MDQQETIDRIQARQDRTDENVREISQKLTEHDVILHNVEAVTKSQTEMLKDLKKSFDQDLGNLSRSFSDSKQFPYGVFWAGIGVLLIVMGGLYSLASKPDELRLDMIEAELVRRDGKFEKLEDQNQSDAAEFANLQADVGALKTNALVRHESIQERLAAIDGKTHDRFTKADGLRHGNEICELQSEMARLRGLLGVQ